MGECTRTLRAQLKGLPITGPTYAMSTHPASPRALLCFSVTILLWGSLVAEPPTRIQRLQLRWAVKEAREAVGRQDRGHALQ